MLKEHLEQLGIKPRVIQLCLMDYLDIMRSMTDETIAIIDPEAYHQNKLALAQVELLLAYLMM